MMFACQIHDEAGAPIATVQGLADEQELQQNEAHLAQFDWCEDCGSRIDGGDCGTPGCWGQLERDIIANACPICDDWCYTYPEGGGGFQPCPRCWPREEKA